MYPRPYEVITVVLIYHNLYSRLYRKYVIVQNIQNILKSSRKTRQSSGICNRKYIHIVFSTESYFLEQVKSTLTDKPANLNKCEVLSTEKCV